MLFVTKTGLYLIVGLRAFTVQDHKLATQYFGNFEGYIMMKSWECNKPKTKQ